MRQLPVIGLLLLIPANAVSAAHFHVRSTTYACVDPKAALAPANSSLRAQGRCFRVHPTQRLEQIWRPNHSLVLLRLKPPHAGEPPLYFRTSSVVPLRLHHARHGEWERRKETRAGSGHASAAHGVARGRFSPQHKVGGHGFGGPEVFDLPSAVIAPAALPAPAAAALGMPSSSLFEAQPVQGPAPKEAAGSNAPASNAVAPRGTADPVPAIAPKTAVQAGVVRPAGAAQETGRFNHVFATLLLWALILAGVVLLVRIALLRRPRPAEAADRPLREPTWSGSSIWPEPPAEPSSGRLPVGAGPGDAASQAGQGWATGQARPPEPARTLYGAPAGAVGYASSYAIGQVAAGPAGAGRPDPDWPVRERGSQEDRILQEDAIPQEDGQPAGLSAYKNRCVAGLRHAGWDARTRFSAGVPGPDVIARSGGLVLALRCLPSAEPVDVEAVEDACLVRERQRSDLAAIVSNAAFTDAARQLAARTGIVLLHENELSSFAA